MHIIDAAVIAGDDIRREPYAERRRRLALLVDGLRRDEAICRQMNLAPPKVRLKPAYGLSDLPRALAEVAARRERPNGHEGSEWRSCGLLFFPGNGVVLLPLEQSHGSRAADWTGPHLSKSQGMEYWHNSKTGKAVWRHERKGRPVSFKSGAANLLRWCAAGNPLTETKLVELTAAAVAAAERRKGR